MREMAVPLSLAAHSAVADFESCRRLPASDILAAYERFFSLAAGSLVAVRQRALAERAALEAGQPSSPAAYVKDGSLPARSRDLGGRPSYRTTRSVSRAAKLSCANCTRSLASRRLQDARQRS